jgi:hypothetical protein
MGRLNKRQINARRQQTNNNGRFGKKEMELPLADDDFDLPTDLDAMDARILTMNTQMKEDDGQHLRAGYTGDSTATYYRKRNLEKEWAAEAATCSSLLRFGFTKQQRISDNVTMETIAPVEQDEISKINTVLPALSKSITPQMNATSTFNKRDAYHFCRMLAVYHYYRFRVLGDPREMASIKSADLIWNEKVTTYRYRAIRKWADEYLETNDLHAHSQGKHGKHESVLSLEDVKFAAMTWISQQPPAKRSVLGLKAHLEENVIPDIIGGAGQVSERTIKNYMHVWRYRFRKNNKDIYFDGHEREDVKIYREGWSKRMMDYKKRMDSYTGEYEEIVVPPTNNRLQKIVMVTHDESTFYAHDGKETVWLLDDEHPILKKGQGLSIMVSEFQCPCHGTMRYGDKISRTLFYAGANRDGYWTSQDMVKQLDEVVPLFESLHPGCLGLFLFDQSSNHNAYPANALVASRMTLRPKKVTPNDIYNFKNTQFYDTLINRPRQQSLYKTRTAEDGSQVNVEFKGKKKKKSSCIGNNK